jgi:SAM-dependent methyltransferase
MYKVKNLIKQTISRCIDIIHGTDTEDNVSIEELKLTPEKSVYYNPVDWFSLKYILKNMTIHRNDCFIDIGCGKGRAMMIASKFSFSKILGVEISENLCATAEKNLIKYGVHKERFQVINQNIEEFELPECVNFIFLFNPFHGITFDRFIEKLIASINMNPRRITIIYRNPKCHDKLMNIEGINESTVIPKRFNGGYKIYTIEELSSGKHQKR